MTARYIVGDVFETMAELPDGSVDLVLTSPPFLALRSYLPPDHPDKGKEIGSEATPVEFIDTMLRLTAEWRRLLTPHGSICVELGDTFSGSGGSGGDYGPDGLRDGQERFDGSGARGRNGRASMVPAAAGGHHLGGTGWPLDKSLALVPELYRLALAYGINPLTGEPSPAGTWRVRNVVRWCRPNPPVGALGDKFRPATSEMVVACTARDRWFDLDAVRGPSSSNTHARTAAGIDRRPSTGKAADDERRGGNWSTLDTLHDSAGAPPLDWWDISTQPYKGAHYATWPPALCVRPILAMCPQRVCTTCGQPSRRIVDAQRTLDGEPTDLPPLSRTERNGAEADGVGHWRKGTDRTTVGWSDCGHDTWRPGVVLDPFAGSGTTLAVATGHGRDAIGIDIDDRNADLARQRVGMLLDIETSTTEPAA